jgi:hypothetical protein
VLLLQDLLKATPHDHAEYQDLVLAVEKIRETADSINSRVKAAESLTQLYDIQARLSGSDVPIILSNHRRLVREGELTEICDTTPKLRYVYLFNDMMVVGVKVNKMISESLSQFLWTDKILFIEVIPLRRATVEVQSDNPPSEIFYF